MKHKKTDCVNDYFETLIKCKEHFKSGDLYNAKQDYNKLGKIFDDKLDKFDRENDKNDKLYEFRRNHIFAEYTTMIDCLTYEELYTLTNHQNWILTDCED